MRFTRSEAVERTPVSIEREDLVSEFSSSNITVGNGLPQLLLASSAMFTARNFSVSICARLRNRSLTLIILHSAVLLPYGLVSILRGRRCSGSDCSSRAGKAVSSEVVATLLDSDH